MDRFVPRGEADPVMAMTLTRHGEERSDAAIQLLNSQKPPPFLNQF
jgi:hypothetical protein